MREFLDFAYPSDATLETILAAPADRTLVTWQIDGLAAIVLRGLPLATLAALNELGGCVLPGYVIRYVPGRELAVTRLAGRCVVLAATRRVVYGCAGLFGRDRLATVLRQREAADMSDMLGVLREHVRDAGLALPGKWCGPGDLAAAQLRRAKIEVVADPAEPDMSFAYHGGRIEVTAHGDVTGEGGGPLYEYDLRSAYSAAMATLPPPGGKWHDWAHPDGEVLSLADWRVPRSRQRLIGPLPVRGPTGVIYYPLAGRGLYWERELMAAERFGASVRRERSWSYVPPERGWPAMRELTEAMFAARATDPMFKAIGPACYGKFLQARGSQRRHSLTYASLVTATVRAWLLDLMSQAPDDIVMIATDSVWSRVPLRADTGPGLGQWKVEAHPGRLHIVAPGIYWSGERLRSAGWRRSDIAQRCAAMERLWRQRGQAVPSLTVPVTTIGTVPLACLYHDAEVLGQTTEIEMTISYAWAGKRRLHLERRDGIWRSLPKRLGPVNIEYVPPARPDIRQMVEAEL